MEVTSSELCLLADTVPSVSEHDFLVEAIEHNYHKTVAGIQLEASEQVRDLQLVYGNAANKSAQRMVARQMKSVYDEKIRKMNAAAQKREENLQKLQEWEGQISS